MATFRDRVLDYQPPPDRQHMRNYAFVSTTVTTDVNKCLKLPYWHWKHDQGSEGACVGHGTSMMKSILDGGKRYNPWWLWNESKKIDYWADTNPGDSNGTSVTASCDVLRAQGHTRYGVEIPNPDFGIKENRWAWNVDEMRTAISQGIPMSIGVNWYSNFDTPEKVGAQTWMGRGDLGSIRGGHCVCIYGASDRKEAFRVKNSWGTAYPLVWLPYETMERLIREDGEVALVTDK